MKFEYPGSDVAFWTGIWIALGGFAIWIQITSGEMPWFMGLCLVIGMFGLGMWFRLRSAGYVFGIITLLLAVIGLFGLFWLGFSWKKLMHVGGNFYSAWAAYEWLKKTRDETDW